MIATGLTKASKASSGSSEEEYGSVMETSSSSKVDNAPISSSSTTGSTSSISRRFFDEEHFKLRMEQANDQEMTKLFPIFWANKIKKKSDWWIRWDEFYLVMDGLYLRLFESKQKYEEALEVEEKQYRKKCPHLSPRLSSFLHHHHHHHHKKQIDMSTTTTTTTSSSWSDKKNYWTVTRVMKDKAGRAFGLCIHTKERKPIHLAVDSELERVVWIHLIQSAINQKKQLLVTSMNSRNHSPLHPADRNPFAMAQTLHGTPINVNLYMFYECWGSVINRRGNFGDFIPSLHPNIAISSNLPPSVPIAGEFHGHEGLLCFLQKLHQTIDISHFTLAHIARSGNLAVVTGKETIKNARNNRKFRHLWKHEVRFETDGRISYIHIVADKVAAAVAFGGQSDAPGLALPHEQEISAINCPPGEVRVVCVSAENLKRRKGGPVLSSSKVVLSLQGFSRAMGIQKTSNGACKVYSTQPSKQGNGSAPLWTETMNLYFSGAVPGAIATCLFLEIWSLSMMGDELIGIAKINLADHLSRASNGTEEQIASDAIPKWYEIYRPEDFMKLPPSSNSNSSGWGSSSIGVDVNGSGSSSSSSSSSSCGRVLLSISFHPYDNYVDEETIEAEINVKNLPTPPDSTSSAGSATPTPIPTPTPKRHHRKSFELLQALHEETGQKEKESLERSSSAHCFQATSSSSTSTRHSTSAVKQSSSITERSSSSSFSKPNPNEMYTFTVSSTKFRVYTRYQLIRAIGHGAYGVVIAASDQVTGNSVAIKNIPKTFDDLVDAKRIVREIRLMRHLRHPNIVHVLDVMRPPSLDTFEDTYIVTDLMETDLHRVITSQEPLSSEHIAYMGYQILCGLKYLHSACVLHRDIKPSNILVNRDCLVKICDFGLARGFTTSSSNNNNDGERTPSGTEAAVADLTRDGGGKGGGEVLPGSQIAEQMTEYVVTRWYRAPELLLASKYSTAIDVWSVGCILMEMFNRKPLFPGHDHVHQLNLILQAIGSPSMEEMNFITNTKAKRWMARQPQHEKNKNLSVLCPSAPPEAIDLMTKLLQFDPRQRFSVEKALEHSWFASYRTSKEDTEFTADKPFDFSFENDLQDKEKLDKKTFRRLIFEDVCFFHPEAQEELKKDNVNNI